MTFDHSLVERFFRNLSASRAAQNTIYKNGTALRQFSKWGKRRGLWANDVMDDPQFKFKMADKLPKPFTDSEMDKLMSLPLTGVENVARAILCYTGLRASPVCTLKMGDVDLSPIQVENESLPGSIRASKNKGSKVLLLPMTEELHAILSAWIADNPGQPYDPLLRRANGSPYTRTTLERWARSWGDAAKVVKCHPHRFRHSLATALLRKGVRIEVVPRILGHVSIMTTMAYTRLSDAETIKAFKIQLR
jgi:integrase